MINLRRFTLNHIERKSSWILLEWISISYYSSNSLSAEPRYPLNPSHPCSFVFMNTDSTDWPDSFVSKEKQFVLFVKFVVEPRYPLNPSHPCSFVLWTQIARIDRIFLFLRISSSFLVLCGLSQFIWQINTKKLADKTNLSASFFEQYQWFRSTIPLISFNDSIGFVEQFHWIRSTISSEWRRQSAKEPSEIWRF